MANTLKLKRGNSAQLGTVTLEAGEPAFTLDTGKLYIGDGTDKVAINPDNVPSATKLETARQISVSGTGITGGSANFDGTSNININVSLPTVAVPSTYTKVSVDAQGRVTSGSSLSVSDIPTLTLAKISDAGSAASKDVGTNAGNVPVLDGNGKLDANVVPAIAISNTYVVDSEAEMLALTVQIGDVAIRNDLSKSFILKDSNPSVIESWQELLTPISPVQSVAGKTGIVTLTSADVGLGNVTNESKATMFTNPIFTGTPTAPTASADTNTNQLATTAFVIGQRGTVTPLPNGTAAVGSSNRYARQDHVHPTDDTRAPINSPSFTGTPTAPTPTPEDDSTRIATTAFVHAQSFLGIDDVIDCGTF